MTYPSFSAGDVLAASDMNAVGLWKTGATKTTNVANLDVQSCFSSSYDNYRVVISVINASAISNLRLRVLSGTNTPDTGLVYDRFGFSWSSSATNQASANEASLYLGAITNASNTRLNVSFDIYEPNNALETKILPYAWWSSGGDVAFMACRIETTTAYTGLRLFCDSGNLTGSMRVYGYQN